MSWRSASATKEEDNCNWAETHLSISGKNTWFFWKLFSRKKYQFFFPLKIDITNKNFLKTKSYQLNFNIIICMILIFASVYLCFFYQTSQNWQQVKLRSDILFWMLDESHNCCWWPFSKAVSIIHSMLFLSFGDDRRRAMEELKVVAVDWLMIMLRWTHSFLVFGSKRCWRRKLFVLVFLIRNLKRDHSKFWWRQNCSFKSFGSQS